MALLGTWSNRLKLTIDNTKVDATLTDFPVVIKLGASVGISGFDATAVFDELTSDANRKKIAVTTSDEETQCYVEIEKWDDGNEIAVLHVKVPSVSDSADTILYLYYDSSQADNTTYVGDTTDTVTHNVWDSNFEAVYHMAQDPNGDVANSIKDSTSNANDGTPSGSMTTADLVSSQVGDGIDFDGSDDQISLGNPASLSLSGDITISVIFKTTTVAQAYQALACKDAGGNANYDFFVANDELIFQFYTGSWHIHESTSANLSVDTYYLLTSVLDTSGNTVKIYKNDTEIYSAAETNNPTPNGASAYIGFDTVAADRPEGTIDEVSISSTARSAAWIKATYNSLWDSLITFGSSPEVSASPATITLQTHGALVTLNSVATFLPGVSGDDGYLRHAIGDSLLTSYDYLVMGWSDEAFEGSTFIRFPNINFGTEAVIQSAFVRFTAYEDQSGTEVDIQIKGASTPNQEAPTTPGEYDAISRTTSYVNWTNIGAWTSGNAYDSVDITSILNEIISDESWQPGDSVLLDFRYLNADLSAHRIASSIDDTGGIYAPQLIIEVNYPIEASTAAITLSTHAAAIQYDINILATPATITLTGMKCSVGDVEVEASAAAIALATHAADILVEFEILASSTAITLSTHAADIALNVSISTSSAPIALSSHAATVFYELAITLEEEIFAYDRGSWAWLETIAESADITEAVDARWAWTISDWMTIREAIDGTWSYNIALIDSLHVVGEAFIINMINEIVTETIDITDAATLNQSIVETIAETFAISETVAATMMFNPEIQESIAITGALNFIKTINEAITEGIDITDDVKFSWDEAVSEILVITDAPSMIYQAMITIAESASIADALTFKRTINESIEDALTFAAAVTMQQSFNIEVEDGFGIGVTVILDDEQWQCWVVNTNAFHMSVYSGFDFNSYAVMNNTAYGLKSDGLYKIGDGATDDDGSEIHDGIVLPSSFFGVSNYKRFRRGYFGISGDSPAIRMETDNGSQTYTITSSKATISRAQKGREWVVKVADFESLDFIELIPIILAR